MAGQSYAGGKGVVDFTGQMPFDKTPVTPPILAFLETSMQELP
jgi:hypothetical protein